MIDGVKQDKPAPTSPTSTSGPATVLSAAPVIGGVGGGGGGGGGGSKVRVDWAVMAVDEYRDAVALPDIPGVLVVPAITLSFDNWTKYRGPCESWIRRDLGAFKDLRPIIALDDERKDWRADANGPEAQSLRSMYSQVRDLSPWANVMLRGPYQCTAAPWMVADGDKMRAHQVRNNDAPLREWLLLMRSFCPTLYLPDALGVGAAGSSWELQNLREFRRLLAYHHLEGTPTHPMVSPFVDGRWDRGAVDSTRLLKFLRSVVTTRPASIVVWGYAGHGEQLAADAWRAVLPRLTNVLRIACGGEFRAPPAAG